MSEVEGFISEPCTTTLTASTRETDETEQPERSGQTIVRTVQLSLNETLERAASYTGN